MIRFFGGRVMTLANGIETQDIEVWTEGSKIVFVGKPTAEELDGKAVLAQKEQVEVGNFKLTARRRTHLLCFFANGAVIKIKSGHAVIRLRPFGLFLD